MFPIFVKYKARIFVPSISMRESVHSCQCVADSSRSILHQNVPRGINFNQSTLDYCAGVLTVVRFGGGSLLASERSGSGS
jgi:hypothetical protein